MEKTFLVFTEYVGEVLCLYETDFGSNFTGYWEALPSKVFLLCDLWEKLGWYTIHCGCNQSDSLH